MNLTREEIQNIIDNTDPSKLAEELEQALRIKYWILEIIPLFAISVVICLYS